MKLTKKQADAAISAGLAVLDPESPALVPVKHMPGLMLLRMILQNINSGQIVLTALAQETPDQCDTPTS